GAASAGWGGALGFFSGYALQGLREPSPYDERAGKKPLPPARRLAAIQEIGFSIGAHTLALQLTLVLSGFVNGWVGIGEVESLAMAVLRLSLPLVVFAIFHGVLYLVDFALRPERAGWRSGREIVDLFLLEFLPLPFVLLSLLAFTAIGGGVIFVLGAAPVIVVVLYSGLTNARTTLEWKRKELAVLNEFSQQLRSSVKLADLLAKIQRQFVQALAYENFYVALYDPERDQVDYPLVVVNGERAEWPSRRLSDYLTDQALRTRKTMAATFTPLGTPRFEPPLAARQPSAWFGVPLTASERAVGCLGVYAVRPGTVFAPSDIVLMTTICGQIGVAVENALLYEQAQLRATQLEMLSHLTSLITASLDPQEVLPQVCRAVTQVGGSRSAIFLYDPATGKATLASSYQLSPEFVAANRSFSVAEDERARCLHTQRDYFAPDLTEAALPPALARVFDREQIKSLGSFPLITQEGPLGILTVYYDTRHQFDPMQVDLLHTFAAQAAIAVANARRYSYTDMALARRVQQLSMLDAAAREFSAAIHSDKLFTI
ncbi:MAG TPA: GAF domain-containing protein, partial [Anaerolineales bacterium]|nr:GAF domain-containing protein [Anaerolineales bacterium]